MSYSIASNSYFGRNMHKNALFLLKNCKNVPALGPPQPNLLASGGCQTSVNSPILHCQILPTYATDCDKLITFVGNLACLATYVTLFYKNNSVNSIRTRGSLCSKFKKKIKNNPSLSRRAKSQIFNLRIITGICS